MLEGVHWKEGEGGEEEVEADGGERLVARNEKLSTWNLQKKQLVVVDSVV